MRSAMPLALRDVAALTQSQRAAAARVLREALAHLPSGFQGPDEAEAEVDALCNEPQWLGFAAMDQEQLVGWIGAFVPIPMAGSCTRWSSTLAVSGAASDRRSSPTSRRAPVPRA